jgi:hypothetical protein
MALFVILKTVSELRGKSDRIAKVTFRGREAPVSEGPQFCKLAHSVPRKLTCISRAGKVAGMFFQVLGP